MNIKIINDGTLISNKKLLGVSLPNDEPPSVGVGAIPGLWQDTIDIWKETDTNPSGTYYWSDDSGPIFVPD